MAEAPCSAAPRRVPVPGIALRRGPLAARRGPEDGTTPVYVAGVLVLYHRPLHYADAATVGEHIGSFAIHSRYPVWEVNTALGFPRGLERVRPRAIVLHYSLFGSGLYMLNARFERWLAETRAVKLAFFQDEFSYCRKRFAFVAGHGIDHVFTHIDPKHWDATWHAHAPQTRPHFNIPGYVADDLLEEAASFGRPDGDRDIDVGYRGRALPPWMGSGGQEKRIIGDRFREFASDSGLRLDIATDEGSRVYGQDWYRFLGRCRAILGVESGTSYIDLEDQVYEEYRQRLHDGALVTLEALQEGALGRWDGNIPYRTLGPRHFEAAAFRICQVMFEGEYSDVLRPMEHYIPLARDFSNLEEVVRLVADPDVRARLTENTHRDLIDSGHYTYAAFVGEVDDALVVSGLKAPAEGHEQRLLSEALAKDAWWRSTRGQARWRVVQAAGRIYPLVAPVTQRMRRRLEGARSGAGA